MVGWVGVATLQSSAVKSLEYHSYMDYNIISYALGMLCAHIPPFHSKRQGEHATGRRGIASANPSTLERINRHVRGK